MAFYSGRTNTSVPDAGTNSANRAWIDAELFSQHCLRKCGGTDSQYVFIRQSGGMSLRATFGCPIDHVVGASPKKQVIWSHAGGHVATMKNTHTLRDRAIVEFPRKTVGAERSVACTRIPRDLPVTPRKSSIRGPQPAPIRFVDLYPKALFEWNPRVGSRHGNHDYTWAGGH